MVLINVCMCDVKVVLYVMVLFYGNFMDFLMFVDLFLLYVERVNVLLFCVFYLDVLFLVRYVE